MLAFLLLSLLTPRAECTVLSEDLDKASIAYMNAQEKVRLGQAKEGLSELRALSRSAPWFGQTQWAIAKAEHARGNFVWAYMAYKRYTYAPAHPDDRTETKAKLKELEKKEPAFAAYADAEQAALRKDWPKTLELVQLAIDRKAKFPLAYRLLGVALAATGKDDASVDAYTRYIELDPDAPERVELEEFFADYKAAK